MLAAGIAAGALIGPGPAVSLASTSRAAAVGRVLALLALGEGARGSGSGPLLSSGASHTSSTTASQPAPATASERGSKHRRRAGRDGRRARRRAATDPPPSLHTVLVPQVRVLQRLSASDSSTTPAAGGGEGEATKATTLLPPVAHVWLIVLPYGTSVTKAPGQSAAAPYIDGQLAGQGTVLSAYTSLAAKQIAGAATLLSGQEAASVSTISPPACGTAAQRGRQRGSGIQPGGHHTGGGHQPGHHTGAGPGQALHPARRENRPAWRQRTPSWRKWCRRSWRARPTANTG